MIKTALWSFLFIHIWWKISRADPSQDWNNSTVGTRGSLSSVSTGLPLIKTRKRLLVFICVKPPWPPCCTPLFFLMFAFFTFLGQNELGAVSKLLFEPEAQFLVQGIEWAFLFLFKHSLSLGTPLPALFDGIFDFFVACFLNIFSPLCCMSRFLDWVICLSVYNYLNFY